MHHAVFPVTELSALYTHIYPARLLAEATQEHTAFYSRCILITRNNLIAEINSAILETVPGPVTEFLSADKVQDAEAAETTEHLPSAKLLRLFELGSLPPSTLQLKLGIPVILL